MSPQQQGQNYQSGHHQPGHYQTSNPYPPQQYGQSPQPPLNTHNDRLPSHHAHTSYPEGSLQYPPPGQGYDGRSPYMGTVSFPEPQHSSASPPQSYFPSSQTTPSLSVGTHQHERRGSHGQFPATESFSDGQRLYPAGAVSDTGGSSNFYSPQPVQTHHGGDYTTTTPQPQDWNATVRTKAPPYRPADTRRPSCRFPNCTHVVFLDTRINEVREWCSDQHMLDAIRCGLERPCVTCRRWPRRIRSWYCSNYCS